ncbi:uncharacterized protein [Antedon mediterranea]|uniref:uncharacterized protein n=1 Tax=Antedon mediterranea TaxID=105859 RepID=UPI003AF7BBDD
MVGLLLKTWMIGLATLVWSSACHGEATTGKEFIAMFLQMNVIEKDPTFIVSTTELSTVVTITIPKLDYTQVYNVPQSSKLEVSVPKSIVPTSDGVDKLGIFINSSNPITLWGVHDASDRSVDGFLVLPTDVLGREYFGVSFEPHSGAELGVVAVEDSTSILINFNQRYFYKTQFIYPRIPLRITLNRFETLFITSYDDLTGIRVTASAPVAAFSGNQCTFIPVTSNHCDYTVTQLIPFSRWGMNYIVTSFLGHTDYIIKIVAGRMGTTVNIGEGKHRYELNQLQSVTLNLHSSEVITASHPIMVAQFTYAQALVDGTSHAAMTVIPSVRQYTNSAVIATMVDDQLTQHFFSLVSACYNFQNQYILLNGMPIDFNTTNIYLSDAEYCTSKMVLNSNYNTITTSAPDALFYAVINERSEFFSTARVANFQLPQATCVTTNEYDVNVTHECDEEVVIFTYSCPEPCPVDDEEELICGTCFDGYAIFLVILLSSGLTICVDQFIKCCRAGGQEEWEVEDWKRRAAMMQKAFDTGAWDRQLEIIRKNERKKLEIEFGDA